MEFAKWLRKPAEGWTLTFRDNKHMVDECSSPKDAFCNLYSFDDLRDECPLAYEQDEETLICNDTLWAEDQIEKAFQNA
jgi:hypothetical protein